MTINLLRCSTPIPVARLREISSSFLANMRNTKDLLGDF